MIPNSSHSVVICSLTDPLLLTKGVYAESGHLTFLKLFLPPFQLNLFLDFGNCSGSPGSGDLFCWGVHAIFLRYNFVQCNLLQLEFVGVQFTSTNPNWSALYYYTNGLVGGEGVGLLWAYELTIYAYCERNNDERSPAKS